MARTKKRAKKVATAPKRVQIGFVVSPRTKRHLVKASKKHGKTMSKIMTQLIEGLRA